MREWSHPVREAQGGAVRASPTAGEVVRYWLKALAFAVAAGAFLAFVGAFGTDVVPPLPRYAVFIANSIATMAVAFGVVALLLRIPGLAARQWLFQVVAVAVLTPANALIVWVIVGFAVLNGPKAAALPAYLVISIGMTIAMSALSQLVFRRRRAPGPVGATRPAPAHSVRFLERLPAGLKGADLWAVQAEDHYVRLHTSKGSALILLRLADATAELDGIEGARVHRSWWVARSAVAGSARRGAQTVLKLPNGIEAPVSRSQASALRRAGWW
jgi:hypothetical protein